MSTKTNGSGLSPGCLDSFDFCTVLSRSENNEHLCYIADLGVFSILTFEFDTKHGLTAVKFYYYFFYTQLTYGLFFFFS